MLTILATLYVIIAVMLAAYALAAWALTVIFLFVRRRVSLTTPPPTPPIAGEWPRVTVQLPIYNEQFVVTRLVEGIVRLDYPRDRLQIQLLDDSTDETTEIARACVEQYQQQGVDIQYLHRENRVGFKAGALREAMAEATGEYLAIFDADFVPEPDFLRQTVPHLVQQPEVGFLQTRWGHLNRDYSHLTAAQAVALDGHFTIEQTARHQAGFLMNFNGTAGLWRRTCIDSSGGWQDDTISEDFDLSYRAQLCGWQGLYLPGIVAPAEVPPQLAAYKRQQFRWAKGSIQCLKKLFGRMLRSEYGLAAKFDATIRLSSYLIHPLMILIALITPIFMLSGAAEQIRFPLVYLSILSLGPIVLFLTAQAALIGRQWWRRIPALLLLIFLGSGIALNNSRAVIEAFLNKANTFRRTPKFNVITTEDRWQHNVYRLPLNGIILGEIFLALYSFTGAIAAALSGHLYAVPFILLYAFGFGYVSVQGLWDARREWRMWYKTRFSDDYEPQNKAKQQPKASMQ